MQEKKNSKGRNHTWKVHRVTEGTSPMLRYQSIYSNKVKKMAGGERKREREPSRKRCLRRLPYSANKVGQGEKLVGRKNGMESRDLCSGKWEEVGGVVACYGVVSLEEERRGVSDLSFSLHH